LAATALTTFAASPTPFGRPNVGGKSISAFASGTGPVPVYCRFRVKADPQVDGWFRLPVARCGPLEILASRLKEAAPRRRIGARCYRILKAASDGKYATPDDQR